MQDLLSQPDHSDHQADGYQTEAYVGDGVPSHLRCHQATSMVLQIQGILVVLRSVGQNRPKNSQLKGKGRSMES